MTRTPPATEGFSSLRDRNAPIGGRRRRPLGASLEPADRLVAYEQRIRELHASIDDVVDALADVDRTGSHASLRALRATIVALQESRERQIGRQKGRKPRTETVPST